MISMALDLTKVLVLGDYKAFGDSLFEGMTSFIEGLTQGQHEVLRYDFREKRIGPCDACGSCNKGEYPCSYLDDFNPLANLILSADVLVLFSEGCFSDALTNALGKFTAFSTHEKRDTHLSKVILVYEGKQNEAKRVLRPWVMGLLNLEPQKARVIRYEKIRDKEKAELRGLGKSL
jgi:hypothetical protein